MSVTNPWLTPYQRSYQSIKAKLIENLKNIKDSNENTLITDYSEGNILIMIISMFAAIAEVIHYYIDNMVRETFFSTARRFDSLAKHGELVDYHARGAIAPTVDVVITRPVDSTSASADILISKGTEFTDSSGNTWLSTKDVTWSANTTSVKVPCIQHTLYEDTTMEGYVLGNMKMSGSTKRVIIPSLNSGQLYDNGTMSLKIDNKTWTLVDTFAHSGKYDQHFRVEVDANKNLYIVFGDDVNGMIPDPGYKITECKYYTTVGSNANISAGSINTVPSTITSSCADAQCNNPYKAAGGSDYEDYYMLREHIPAFVRTLGVAITKKDFIDLAKTVDGVNKVAMEFECGRKLNLYITPDNGIVASQTLLEKTYEFIKQHCPVTTWLNVKPVGEVKIILGVKVVGKKNYSASEINDQIITALKDKYSASNSEIGGSVRISDLYALMDNLSGVDYLNITKFFLKPWPETINGSVTLKIKDFSITSATGNTKYLIVFSGAKDYIIYSTDGGFSISGKVGNSLTVNDTINGCNFGITIQDNSYSAGDRFMITISEPNVDYNEPGYNIPIFEDDTQITLDITETL